MREIDPVERFQAFLKSFKTKEGEYKYRRKLAQMSITGAISLVVDFEDLLTFDAEWARALLDEPDEYLDHACSAATKQLAIEDPEYAEKIRKAKVRFHGVLQKVPLRGIGDKYINKMVVVDGVVVRATQTLPLITKAAFECRRCGYVQHIDQGRTFLTPPLRCGRESCRRTGPFDLRIEESTFVNSQDIRIQERPEDLPPGQLPQSIDIRLLEDLVDTARPGDRVSVIGIVRAVEKPLGRRGAISRTFPLFIEGNYIESAEREVEVTISPEDEKKIIELSKDPLIHRKIVQSIAPSIYGHETIKEAIMYMLFGGTTKVLPDGVRIRGDIHALLIGDPGTAKSQILQYVASIAPRGLYTSGKGTTAAGITAAVVREKEGLVLEAGALVLADKGVCCIDEIDKMNPGDRERIHTAMEQQIISISKGGINATLNSRVAILAAGNPALGRYDPHRTVADNINLPPTILERFDLIFIMKDEPQREIDREMANHVIHLHKTGTLPVAPPLDQSLLRKYISYAKLIEPKLTDDASKRLNEFYLKVRSLSSEAMGAPVAISIRQLQSLIRIAEARARVALRKEVTVEDAEVAIAIMKKSFEQTIETMKGWDIDIIMTGKPKALRDKLSQVVEAVSELEKEEGMASLVELFEKLREYGVERPEADSLLTRLKREGVIYSPKPGYVKKV